MALKLTGNRRYPSIPQIGVDLKNHADVLRAVKESLEIGERRTTDVLNSFVRVGDLVDLGLVTIEGNTTNVVGADLSEIADIGDLSGAAESDFLRYRSGEWVNDQLDPTDITQAFVTQHQAALSITWSQITGEPALIEDVAGLVDPGADRILFWDDSAGELTWLTAGTNLTITGTTITASGGGGGGGGGSATEYLNDLLDVEAVYPSINDTLRWTGSVWATTPDEPIHLDDLVDVESYVPNDGDVLTWDAAGGIWTAAAPAGASLALDSLTDVDAYSPYDGDLLSYRADTGQWINVPRDDPVREFEWFNDCYSTVASTTGEDWSVSASGVTLNAIGDMETGKPGIFSMTTGATAAISVGVAWSGNSTTTGQGFMVLGGGEIVFESYIRIVAMLTGAETGFMRVGLMDEISGAPSNAIQWQYDATSANHQILARAGGTTTIVFGVTPVTTGWHHIRIEVAADGLSAELFVNGVPQGRVDSNMPVLGVATAALRPAMGLQKSTGTTAITAKLDWMRVRQSFTSLRGTLV